MLECLQHILKMYAWSLSENQVSIQLKCKLVGLMLKQSFFRKHDFAVQVSQIYFDYQNQCIWQLRKYSNNSHAHVKKKNLTNQLNKLIVVENLSYFHLMSFSCIHQPTYMNNSISFFNLSNKMTHRIQILMMVIYSVVCLLIFLFQS